MKEKFLACFGALLILVTPDAFAAPRKPTADTEVLERLPQRALSTEARTLADLRQEFSAAPADSGVAARLARAYFYLAAQRGDPRFVGYADAVVARFDARAPADILLVRGMLKQYRHEFGAALADFEAALGIDPGLVEAHSWRAAIFLVNADYVAAQKECDALARSGRAVMAGGCQGLLLAYTGRLGDARRTLQTALGKTDEEDNRLWLLTRLAEVAGWQGQATAAERYYRQALAIGPDDAYLLTAWADFLLAAGRYDEVVSHLAGREANDALLLRLAEAEAKLGRASLHPHLKALEDRFAAAKLRGDATHIGDEARYRLRLRNDPREAVRLAAENYKVEREPRDALVLLEAAIAAGDPASAAPVRDWLSASGFEDPATRHLADKLFGGGTR